MKKCFLALLMSAVMVLSVTACGQGNEAESTPVQVTATPTPVPATPTPTSKPTPVPAIEGGAASVDFEDGNLGFVTITQPTINSDNSKLSVEEINGSKVLVVKNNLGKKEAYLGIDLSAMLGDKIADVAKVKFDIADQGGEKFSPISGKLYAYTGEGAANKEDLGKWSVYLENKSPKTVTFDISNPFTAGENNYIIISKEDEVDANHGFWVDNIKFLDKNGNLIKADTTALVAENSPLNAVTEKKTFVLGRTTKVESTYAGDWSSTKAIPAAYFADVKEGETVNVVVDITLQDGLDYYLAKPMTASWGTFENERYADLVAASEGDYYHLQSDGFIVIDDKALDRISFTLDSTAAAAVAANGGLAFQTYGVTALAATVSKDVRQTKVEATYAGDWSSTKAIPAAYFANVADGETVNVTVDITLQDGLDYYLAKPMTASWGTFENERYTDLVAASEGDYFHLQSDGFIVIDDRALDRISFTLDSTAAAAVAANGGLAFQTYGVTALSATVSKSLKQTKVEATYAGDWSSTKAIPAAYFADVADGETVNVTVDITLQDGLDYYLAKPMTASWGTFENERYADLVAASAGDYYHLQSDGFIVIDDKALDRLSFTLDSAAAAAIAANGGLAFQTYGVTVLSVVVSK